MVDKDDAIQGDVSEEKIEEEETQDDIDEELEREKEAQFPANVRNATIEEIVENVDKDRNGDLKTISEEESKEEEEAAAAKEGVKKEPEEESEEELITIKVDGKEKQVPRSAIEEAGIRAMQKESAADARLEEATRILKEAKETVSSQEKSALSTAEAKDTDSEEAEDEQDQEDEMTMDGEQKQQFVDLAHTIQYGDEDEAAEALFNLRKLFGPLESGKQTPTVSESDIDRILDAREIRNRFSADPSEGGFKDLMEDEEIAPIVMRRVDQALAQGKPNKWETYEEVGRQVRDKFKLPGASSSASEHESSTTIAADVKDKRVRKKKIDTVRGVTARTPGKEKPTPQTEDEARQQAISDIRRSRGQHLP